MNLYEQITKTLGGFEDEFDVDGIAEALGYPRSVDDVDPETYWTAVLAHQQS